MKQKFNDLPRLEGYPWMIYVSRMQGLGGLTLDHTVMITLARGSSGTILPEVHGWLRSIHMFSEPTQKLQTFP